MSPFCFSYDFQLEELPFIGNYFLEIKFLKSHSSSSPTSLEGLPSSRVEYTS